MAAAGARPLPLAERLRPTRLADLLGNPRARAELAAWAERWRAGAPGARRAVVLVGPPGVGKTTAALAVAAEMGWAPVEMNASDARNQSAIERVAGRASVSQALDAAPSGGRVHRSLILLDEADCLTGRPTESGRPVVEPPALRDFLRGRYGTVAALNTAWGLAAGGKSKPFADWSSVPRSPGNFAWARLPAARRDLDDWRGTGVAADTTDRGGLGAIARLVRSTRQPLVLTVNDDRPLTRYSAVFRTGVARIRFYPIRPDEVAQHLRSVSARERISLAPGAVTAIVARARGDLRAALNDLDAVSVVPPGPGQLEVLGARDRTDDFAGITAEALSSARFYRGAEVRDRLDAPPDDLLPWIEENIVHYAADAHHRAAAFERLAVADRFLRRASRFRVFGLWPYASEMLTGGVGLAVRDHPVPTGGEAAFPRFLGEMGASRGARELREAVVRKIAERFHLSRAKVRAEFFGELEGIARPRAGRPPTARERAVRAAIARELELTGAEAEFLTGLAPDDPESPREADASEGSGPGEDAELDSPPPAASSAEPPPAPKPAQRRQRQLGEFTG